MIRRCEGPFARPAQFRKVPDWLRLREKTGHVFCIFFLLGGRRTKDAIWLRYCSSLAGELLSVADIAAALLLYLLRYGQLPFVLVASELFFMGQIKICIPKSSIYLLDQSSYSFLVNLPQVFVNYSLITS